MKSLLENLIAANVEIEALKHRVEAQAKIIKDQSEKIRRLEYSFPSNGGKKLLTNNQKDAKIEELGKRIHELQNIISGRRKAKAKQPSEMRFMRSWYPETFTPLP